MNERAPIPPVTVVASTNRAGTVTVHATDSGMPVNISFERSEYRYGAAALAAEILRLTRRSTIIAQTQRRVVLTELGVPTAVLDNLGLPTQASCAKQLDRLDDEDTAPTTWTRRV